MVIDDNNNLHYSGPTAAAVARTTNLRCENMKGVRLYRVNFDRRMPAFRHRSPFPAPRFDALLMHPFPRERATVP